MCEMKVVSLLGVRVRQESAEGGVPSHEYTVYEYRSMEDLDHVSFNCGMSAYNAV